MPPTAKLLAATLSILLLALPFPSFAARGTGHGAHHRHNHVTRTGVHRLRGNCTAARCGSRGRHSAHPRVVHPRTVSAPRPSRPRRGHRTTAVEEGTATGPAAVAAVLATPCQNTELTPEAANLSLVRAAVLCLINHARAERGEESLVANAELEAAAEGHCAELISDDYFAHVSPGGITPVDRIRQTGYIPGPSVGYVIGENLAWGTYSLSTPKTIVDAWIASPGHLANILETQYRETGVGVTPAVPASLGGGSPGATYAQEFGVIIR